MKIIRNKCPKRLLLGHSKVYEPAYYEDIETYGGTYYWICRLCKKKGREHFPRWQESFEKEWEDLNERSHT